MRSNWKIPMLVAAALLVAGTAFAAGDLWLHVKVDEGEEGAKVRVNLPFALLEKGISAMPEKHLDHAFVHIDEMDVEVGELREMWNEVRSSPDMTFVTVDEGDERVRIWKEGDYLKIRVEDGIDEEVIVDLPVAMVDALLGGESLDIRAALEILSERGGGELVSVRERDETVRVWVDQTPEAE